MGFFIIKKLAHAIREPAGCLVKAWSVVMLGGCWLSRLGRFLLGILVLLSRQSVIPAYITLPNLSPASP